MFSASRSPAPTFCMLLTLAMTCFSIFVIQPSGAWSLMNFVITSHLEGGGRGHVWPGEEDPHLFCVPAGYNTTALIKSWTSVLVQSVSMATVDLIAADCWNADTHHTSHHACVHETVTVTYPGLLLCGFSLLLLYCQDLPWQRDMWQPWQQGNVTYNIPPW